MKRAPLVKGTMNEQIISIFSRLRDLRIQQGESYRASAYGKAIKEIQRYPKQLESGTEAMALPGIGNDLATKIQEIIATGTVAELGAVDPEKERVIALFKTVIGVGPVIAEKWYTLGYRSLEEIPESILTPNLIVGIRLREHLIQRIPRADIDLLNKYLHQCLDPKGIKFTIAGSYRRGRPDSGDIDIIAVTQPDLDVGAAMIQCLPGFYPLSHGKKKIIGVVPINQIWRQVDIELTLPEEYPFTLLYFTGPMSFNVKQRAHAKQHGLTLDEKSLYDQSGRHYPASTEEDIFKMLGLQYLTPEERDKY